jgi:hypothetical protein
MHVVIGIDGGVPSELLRDGLRVGNALIARGHTVSYVIGEPLLFLNYGGSLIANNVYQAPVPRVAPPLVMKRPPGEGLADQLAIIGFDELDTIENLAAMWNRLLVTLNPDVVIGIYSPVLWLVAPAHARTFAIGNGLALPPVCGSSFPRLSGESAPLADEEKMLTNANAVLARLRQSPLRVLSDVLGRCHQILYGLSACDPFLQHRKFASRGLLNDEANPIIPPAVERLAMFLDVYCPGIESIVLAIAGATTVPIDVCLAGATTGMRRFLDEQEHVSVWNDFGALLDKTANASALVHHGVQDVTERCLVVGRPQLLMPWTREQNLLVASTSWMGLNWVKSPQASVDDIAGTFRALLNDASLMVAAQHHAHEFAKTKLPNALPRILDEISVAAARRRVRPRSRLRKARKNKSKIRAVGKGRRLSGTASRTRGPRQRHGIWV